ncbi:hypothetical protein Mapa_002424 [Marchantia paleacea]|nr:hypothetical protein Mapa_002424 [Marchantia paleacea]
MHEASQDRHKTGDQLKLARTKRNFNLLSTLIKLSTSNMKPDRSSYQHWSVSQLRPRHCPFRSSCLHCLLRSVFLIS